MSEDAPVVFVVDDDPAMRESLRWLIESIGLTVQTHATAKEFLERYDPANVGCLVLDVRMPGLSGLDLQDELVTRGTILPIIMITGYAEVPMAVRAMKAGAIDFIEKPFSDQDLLDRVRLAIDLSQQVRAANKERAEIFARVARLTPREREVCDRVIAGMSNKVIAKDLGLSTKTVEVHRARLMEKLQASTLADLVRLTLLAEGMRENPNQARGKS
jgi:two-component system, LuxR family, response regulator FixJ